MARPQKDGEKKENISISATPTERSSVALRARKLGFSSAAKYLLALHEAEQRIGLLVKMNHEGQRWFVASLADDVPEDITLEEAIHQRFDDEGELPANVTQLPSSPKRKQLARLGLEELRKAQQAQAAKKNAPPPQSPQPAQ